MTQRIIRFRAWDKELKEMTSWESFVRDYHRIPLISLSDEKSFLVFMQYTGLKDKNGVEIYEGDVVEYVYHDKEAGGYDIYRGQIVFEEGAFQIHHFDGDKDNANYYNIERYDIIGNIYENPDLLTPTDEGKK